MGKIIVPEKFAGWLTARAAELQSPDLTVLPSGSNAATLAIHQAERADLIVVDLVDPHLAGETLCLRVRADEALRQVSILLLCNDTDSERRLAESCHANGVLYLPLNPAALLENIRQLLAVADRKSYRVLVQVRAGAAPHRETFHCISRNISASGILLETGKTLAVGERVGCAFFLPGGRQIDAEGEVVRRRFFADGSRTYGVKFTKLIPGTRQALDMFVAANRPPGGRPH